MKYKIKDTREFVDKDGLTKYEVTIQAPIGIFSGVSTLDKEDEPNKSRFFGYDIAEKKAVKKMYQRYIANTKIELKVYEDQVLHRAGLQARRFHLQERQPV